MFILSQILIRKCGCTINAHFPRAVVVDKISSLDHKVFHYTVKRRVFVAQRSLGDGISVLSCAELSEVLACFGALLRYQS